MKRTWTNTSSPSLCHLFLIAYIPTGHCTTLIWRSFISSQMQTVWTCSNITHGSTCTKNSPLSSTGKETSQTLVMTVLASVIMRKGETVLSNVQLFFTIFKDCNHLLSLTDIIAEHFFICMLNFIFCSFFFIYLFLSFFAINHLWQLLLLMILLFVNGQWLIIEVKNFQDDFNEILWQRVLNRK